MVVHSVSVQTPQDVSFAQDADVLLSAEQIAGRGEAARVMHSHGGAIVSPDGRLDELLDYAPRSDVLRAAAERATSSSSYPTRGAGIVGHHDPLPKSAVSAGPEPVSLHFPETGASLLLMENQDHGVDQDDTGIVPPPNSALHASTLGNNNAVGEGVVRIMQQPNMVIEPVEDSVAYGTVYSGDPQSEVLSLHVVLLSIEKMIPCPHFFSMVAT